ncbi:MAG: hypothetical protein JWM43_1770 [Acidobacteriaceae bacterium]|nr:hypothetical protein [Acidobacteriaceae bacterium]
MRILQRRGAVAVVSLGMMFLGLCGAASAKTVPTGTHGMTKSAIRSTRRARIAAAASAAAASAGSEVVAITDDFRLKLHNLHTNETLDIVYRVGDTYVPEAVEKLNFFLRDRHTQDVAVYDPKEFDVLHGLLSRLRRPNGVIDIVCGYRTPETNAALRQNSPQTGVAEHSQHMEGHAIDLRVPGVSTVALRNAALSLHAGGVGYYPVSQFVHVDVGPVRQWAFGRSPRKAGRRHKGARTSVGM